MQGICRDENSWMLDRLSIFSKRHGLHKRQSLQPCSHYTNIPNDAITNLINLQPHKHTTHTTYKVKKLKQLKYTDHAV